MNVATVKIKKKPFLRFMTDKISQISPMQNGDKTLLRLSVGVFLALICPIAVGVTYWIGNSINNMSINMAAMQTEVRGLSKQIDNNIYDIKKRVGDIEDKLNNTLTKRYSDVDAQKDKELFDEKISNLRIRIDDIDRKLKESNK